MTKNTLLYGSKTWRKKTSKEKNRRNRNRLEMSCENIQIVNDMK